MENNDCKCCCCGGQEDREISIDVLTLVETGSKHTAELYIRELKRVIKIPINTVDATMLRNALKKIKIDDLKPPVHQLLLKTMDALSGELHRVVVFGAEEDRYHATLCVQLYDKLGLLMESNVHARAIDALTTAIIGKKPIHVTQNLLDEISEPCEIDPMTVMSQEQAEILKTHLRTAQQREEASGAVT